MPRNKNQNKTSGRIIFGIIFLGLLVVGIIATGDNPPETEHITKIIEHEALN